MRRTRDKRRGPHWAGEGLQDMWPAFLAATDIVTIASPRDLPPPRPRGWRRLAAGKARLYRKKPVAVSVADAERVARRPPPRLRVSPSRGVGHQERVVFQAMGLLDVPRATPAGWRRCAHGPRPSDRSRDVSAILDLIDHRTWDPRARHVGGATR